MEQITMRLTVLICTHDRSALLRRVLASINEARRPTGTAVELLVVANACTDDTAQVLRHYETETRSGGTLPLRWTEEPTPGKSHALELSRPRFQLTCWLSLVPDRLFET